MKSPAKTHVVSDLSQLKALSHELRQDILGAFCGEPKTTKQVAVSLKQPPTKLYHHVEILEKAGLLKLVETKQKRGTTEKYYQAVASTFQIGKTALGEQVPEEAGGIFASAFQAALQDIAKVTNAPHAEGEDSGSTALLARGIVKLTPKGFRRFQERLQEFLNDIGGPEKQKGESYKVMVTLYRDSDGS